MVEIHLEDPVLHEISGPATRWSTVNMAEALPGVLTPLGWSFWRDPCEAGLRAAFADAGVMTRAEAAPPASVDRRLTGIFFGRWAGNLTTVCELCDRTPGSSGASFEEQVFGYADPDVVRARSYRYYPVFAVKMPIGIALLRRRLAAVRSDVDSWWRMSTRPGSDPHRRLAQARTNLSRALRIHMTASLVAQGCYDQVAAVARAAGRPGLELELMTGYGGSEEVRVSSDLWEVSRNRLGMDDFLARHGYHGPNEGELSSRSWREDRRPVERLRDSYASMDDAAGPRRREAERREHRKEMEAELRAAIPRLRRPAATLAVRAAATHVPLKGIGKAAFLQSLDVGRAAAREIGTRLATAGTIADPEDVFYLTIPEITGAPRADAHRLVDNRRALRAEYLRMELPERWTGIPEPVVRPDRGTRTEGDVSGVPVSPGVVEGRARVVWDPAEADDFEPGDILVCETTDPGWVVLFQVAAAVVIDVGGPLSHGAVVARELGLPAVINTRNGTRAIADGDLVRVDGSAGRVEIIAPADRSTHAT